MNLRAHLSKFAIGWSPPSFVHIHVPLVNIPLIHIAPIHISPVDVPHVDVPHVDGPFVNGSPVDGACWRRSAIIFLASANAVETDCGLYCGMNGRSDASEMESRLGTVGI